MADAQAGPPVDETGQLKVKRGGGALIPIIFIIVLIGAVGGAIYWFTMREDPAAVHETFRREHFGPVHATYYPEFWKCALNAPLSNFKNNTALIKRIELNAGGGSAKRYGEHVLGSEKCLPHLAAGLPEYQKLKTNPGVPAEYHPMIDELVGTLEGIQTAWSNYANYLTKADDRSDLRERIEARGKHWVGYQSSINNKVREKQIHYEPNAVVYTRFVQCVLGETSFTSFEGEEGVSPQDQMLAVFDQQCAQNKDAFVAKMSGECKALLYPTEPPVADDAFKAVIGHWTKRDNDFGSAVPMMECLAEADEAQNKALIANIAKAWYETTKSYRAIVEHSKSQGESHFDRGRAAGGESAGE